MALFRSKAKSAEPKKSESAEQAIAVVTPTSHIRNLDGIIRKPRITEKASFSAEKNVYIFEVATRANKKTVAAAVRELYNVTPLKVAIAKIPSKRVTIRGKKGVKTGGKKAYVYLEKGQTIEFA